MAVLVGFPYSSLLNSRLCMLSKFFGKCLTMCANTKSNMHKFKGKGIKEGNMHVAGKCKQSFVERCIRGTQHLRMAWGSEPFDKMSRRSAGATK